MTLISIVTPAYKAKTTIARAVRSVLAQGISDWEMIIVSDDGQDYAAILKQAGIMDERLHFTTTGQVGSGPSRGRNVALDMAAGEYITTLDADDEYATNYLETLQPAAAQYGMAMVYLSHKVKPDGTSQGMGNNKNIMKDKRDMMIINLNDYMTINGCNKNMFSKTLLNHRYPEDIKYSEDFYFDLQLLAQVKAVPLFPHHYYVYHFNENSLTASTQSDQEFIDTYKNCIKKLESADFLSNEHKCLVLAGYHFRLHQNYLYLHAKQNGDCSDFFDFMDKNFPLFKSLKYL